MDQHDAHDRLAVHLADRESFARDGYVRLREVLTTLEVDTLRREAEVLQERIRNGSLPLDACDPKAPVQRTQSGQVARYYRLVHFTVHSQKAREILFQERILDIGRALLGDRARPLHEEAYGVSWQLKSSESDAPYRQIVWHHDYEEDDPLTPLVTVGLYLDPSRADNGGLEAMVGSHHGQSSELAQLTRASIEADAGDAICHHHGLEHGSGPMSHGSRATVYMYFTTGAPALSAAEYLGQPSKMSGIFQ
jgi:hypothetical protein